MRAPAFLFILIVVSLPIGLTASPGAETPFSIVIAGPQKPVKAGSEVKVEILLKNTSDRELAIARTNAVSQAEFHFLIEVRDSQGQPAPDTEYGRRIMGRETRKRTIIYGSDALFTLKPNETLADETVVTKLYDLSRPGKYLIQVSRRVSDDPKNAMVKSNEIAVTVTP